MVKLPAPSVVVERVKSLTGFSMVTVALGITAPLGSVTVPETDVELACCAYVMLAAANTVPNKKKLAIATRPTFPGNKRSWRSETEAYGIYLRMREFMKSSKAMKLYGPGNE